MKKNFKQILKSCSALVLSLTLVLMNVPVFGFSAQGTNSEPELSESEAFSQLLNEFRQEFFDEADDGLDLQTVYIDDDRIIHQPQEYEEPTLGMAPRATSAVTDYSEGSVRSFSVSIYENRAKGDVDATLVKQGDHVNIWVLNKAS